MFKHLGDSLKISRFVSLAEAGVAEMTFLTNSRTGQASEGPKHTDIITPQTLFSCEPLEYLGMMFLL